MTNGYQSQLQQQPTYQQYPQPIQPAYQQYPIQPTYQQYPPQPTYQPQPQQEQDNTTRNMGIMLGLIAIGLGIKRYITDKNKQEETSSTSTSTSTLPTSTSQTSSSTITVTTTPQITCNPITPVTACTATPTPNGRIFLNKTEICAIQDKIRTGINPWCLSYNRLMNTSASLDQSVGWARSIADTSPLPNVVSGSSDCLSQGNANFKVGSITYDAHYYNEIYLSGNNNQRHDYCECSRMGKAVRTLGLSYALTGNTQDADRVAKLIKAWCTDPATYMRPEFTTWYSWWNPLIYISNGLFFGADLIWNYNAWNQTDKTNFVNNWVTPYITHASTWTRWDGAIETSVRDEKADFFRIRLIAAGAALTGNTSLLTYAFNRWKEMMVDTTVIYSDGRIGKSFSVHPDRSLSYSIFDLHTIMHIAEIARHNNTDLYNWVAPVQSNISIEKIFDFYDYYFADPTLTSNCAASWPNCTDNPKNDGSGTYYCNILSGCNKPQRWYDPKPDSISGYCQGQCYSGIDMGAWEYAYLWKQKSTYKDVLDNWQRIRPFVDTRFGFPTLTHAQGAYPFVIYP